MCYCERAALDLKKYAKTALDTESIVAELEFQIKKFRDFDASIDTMTREVWRKSEEKAITIAKEILDRVVAFPNIQAIPEGISSAPLKYHKINNSSPRIKIFNLSFSNN
jgi:hypothetical protein